MMGGYVEIFDCSIRQYDSELTRVVSFLAYCLLDPFPYLASIVWVDPLPHSIAARKALQRINPPDAVVFLRIIDSRQCPIGDPGASVAQPLCFRQIGLAAAQSFRALAERLFRSLPLGQIDHERYAPIWSFIQRRSADQHRNSAAVSSEVLLLPWLCGSGGHHFGYPPCGVVLPLLRCQVCPAHATRDEIFTIVLYQVEKRVIGLDDPTVDIPDKDADDVGLDQAPNLRFAFCEIAIGVHKRERAFPLGFEQAHVFDRDHRLAGEGLEKRDLFVVERSDLPSPDQNYSYGGTLAQQRRRKRGTMALAFCVAAAHRVFAVLCGEIMDMNRPTVACGSSHHPVSVCGKALAGMDSHRNCPV